MTKEAMKFGAVFPSTDIGNDPIAIRDWAQAVEELGYRSIVTFDHVLGAPHENRDPALLGPYTEEHPFHEPFTLFAYLAAVTERVELCTGVIILPQRQTVLVAKQAAEVQLLSGGRFRLGVGSGWNYVEYEALGVPWKGRGKRFSEQVELMRSLWSGEVVDFDGEFHRVDRAALNPVPAEPIPVWFGAVAPAALKRAAQLGDGILFGGSPSMCGDMFETVKVELAAAGRASAAYGAEAMIDFSYGEEKCLAEVEQWREAGGTHLSVRAMDTTAWVMGGEPVGYTGLQSYIDALRTFKGWVGDLG